MLAKRREPDLYRVARHLVKGGMSAENTSAAAATPPYRRPVRTNTPDVEVCVKSLRALARKYEGVDRTGKAFYDKAIPRGETNVLKYVPLFL